MKLLPIKEHLSENKHFADHPDCQESIYVTLEFYKKVGFQIPWISYYAQVDGVLVGAAAFKGKPREGKVEVAYGTFPQFQRKGIGAELCRQLVLLAKETDPSVRILARTFQEENFSTKILKKNGFELLGTVMDDEDGEVWEWEYKRK